ncbi:MAG: hypothetical protein IJO67_00525 [Clostridia bacterium]|nr:hypothetical protein [Clostridia bacterium]
MKPNKKWMAVLLLVIVALCQTACSETNVEASQTTENKELLLDTKTEQNPLFGLWKLNGVPYGAEEGTECYYEFGADYVAKTKVVLNGIIIRENASKYTIEGNKLQFEMENNAHLFSIEGNVMTIDVESKGTSFMILTKEEATATEAQQSTIVGLWELDMDEVLLASGVLPEDLEEEKVNSGNMSGRFEFMADGRVICEETIFGVYQISESTYSLDGNQCTIDNVATVEYVLEGNDRLILKDDSNLLIFNRIK